MPNLNLKAVVIAFWMLLTLFGCSPGDTHTTAPVAQKGVLDLSHWEFPVDGSIALNGEYGFLWKCLASPSEIANLTEVGDTEFIQVPKSWNGHKTQDGHPSGHGYATFYLRIKTSKTASDLALKILDFATAARIFVNGNEVYNVGKVGTSPESAAPQFHPAVVTLGHLEGDIELVLQISNYAHRKGGMWEQIRLGTAAQLQERRNTQISYDLFLFGSILMIGLYHLGIYILRRNERSPLYFGAFCLLIAVRLITTGERYLLEAFDNVPWELLIKLEYLSYYLAVPVFVQFVYSLFSERFSRDLCRIFVLAGFVFTATVILLPARIFSYTLVAYQIFTLAIFVYAIVVLALASINKDRVALVFMVGFCILFLTALNDILHSNNVVNTAYFVPAGLFAFIFSQAFLLSLRYAKAFETIERQQVSLTQTNTVIKQAEEKLKRVNEELEQRVAERTADILKANEALHQEVKERKRAEAAARMAKKAAEIANRAKSEFLANMSHELRTPLNHIIGFSELILDRHFGKLNDDQDEYLRDVYSSSKHLLSLINDILDLSKVESGKLELKRKQFNLKDVLNASIIMFKEKSLNHGIELSVNLDDIPEMLNGDERKIKQIMYNLLSNAVKFTPDGGTVSLEAHKCRLKDETGSGVQISVNDSGIGINPDDLVRIFTPFEQVEQSKCRRFQGTGLGLSLTRQLVELHGGEIWAESRGENNGSSFHVVIPQ